MKTVFREDGEVVVRGFGVPARTIRPRRVVEPELDMDRLGLNQSARSNVWREIVRRLLPGEQIVARLPTRSIAREIEEVWPAREL